MPFQFDHAVIAVQNLDAAMQDYRNLGYTVVTGGIHASPATRSARIIFHDGTSLEFIAATGEPPEPGAIDYRPLLQSGEGLVAFAFRCDDLAWYVRRLRKNGVAVGDIFPGEFRCEDGSTARWKIARLETGCPLFLIQDDYWSQRTWRMPRSPALTTHVNRAIGLRGVEIIAGDRETAWERYSQILDLPPMPDRRGYWLVPGITMREIDPGPWTPLKSPEQASNYYRPFGGSVPQSEIDAADPALEPRDFVEQLERHQQSLAENRESYAQVAAMRSVIVERDEGLFAVWVVREQGGPYYFFSEKTHGVHFRQFPGVPPERGTSILTDMRDFDWSAVYHAYGPAVDIPGYLRMLASDDKDVREVGYQDMQNKILHQGMITPATLETIPFLVQLLNAPGIEDKTRLLHSLESIVPRSLHRPEFRERTLSFLPAALPVFIGQLNHPDGAVRQGVVKLLGVYSADVVVLEPLLYARIAAEADATVRAECVETLFRLWTGQERDTPLHKLSLEQTNYIAGLMRDVTQPPAVHYRAARVLLRDDVSRWLDEATAVFYHMMANDLAALRGFSEYGLSSLFYDVCDSLKVYPDRALDWIVAQANHPEAMIREQVTPVLDYLKPASHFMDRITPALLALMSDSCPEVRQRAVGFFYHHKGQIPDAVISRLKLSAASDVSLTVRVVARNVLESIESQN